jgi:hypothetical protein
MRRLTLFAVVLMLVGGGAGTFAAVNGHGSSRHPTSPMSVPPAGATPGPALHHFKPTGNPTSMP